MSPRTEPVPPASSPLADLSKTAPPPPVATKKPPMTGGMFADAHVTTPAPDIPPAPPSIPLGAAPLAPASFFQAPDSFGPPFAFQTLASPLENGGTAHGAVAPAAPVQPAPQTARAPAEELSDSDKLEIDRWLSDSDHARPGPIADRLGALPKPQQRYLLAGAFDHMGASGFRDLAGRVRNDGKLRGVVAEALVKRAVQLENQRRGRSGASLDANDPHNYARAFASSALIAVSADDAGLAGLLQQMSPQKGSLFARALDDGDRQDGAARLSDARNRILTSLNAAPRTPTTGVIVKILFMQTSAADVAGTPGLADNLVVALAREYHPGDPAAAQAEMPRLAALIKGDGAQLLFDGSMERKAIVFGAVRDPAINARIFDRQTLNYYHGDPARIPVVADAMARALISEADAGCVSADTPAEENTKQRLAGILQTAPGQQLFFSGKAPAEATGLALHIIRTHPDITFETFGGMKGKQNPWSIPELQRAVAEAYAAEEDHRLRKVPGAFGVENLVVGPAMGMIPNMPTGEAWRRLFSDFNAAVAKGTVTPKQPREYVESISDISLYDRPEHAIIHKIAEKIRHVASTDPPRIICEHVTVFTDCGPIRCPRFLVQNGVDAKGEPTYACVDNTAADYRDLAHWQDKNQLPDGIAYSLKPDHAGILKLAGLPTPEASKSTAGKVLDTTALVGCYAAGVAAVVVTGGTIAVVGLGVAAASGGWMAYRSGSNLYDRYDRGQGVLTPEAIGDWLGVIGGVAGAGAVATGLRGAASAAVLQKLAAGVNLVGFGYQGVMLAANWEDMTPAQRETAILQILATGALTVVHRAAPPAMPRQGPREIPNVPQTPAPPDGTILIGSAPRVTPNPAIGKLTPGKAPVTPIRPAPSSPPRKGYDPAASGKQPANGNQPRDVVQPAVRPTADGSAPTDGQPTAMAGNGGKPPDKPKGPTRPPTPSSDPPRPADPRRASRPRLTPVAGGDPSLFAALVGRVQGALHELYRTEFMHGVFATLERLGFGAAVRQYRRVLQEARDALHAYNNADAMEREDLTRLNEPNRATQRGRLPLDELKAVFPDLAQMLRGLHEPRQSGPRHEQNSSGFFNTLAKWASDEWAAFADIAAEGKGTTSELVEAMIQANRALVRLEENMNDAPSPEVRKAWQDRIAQARQILEGYIAQLYLERWLADPALYTDNPKAAPPRQSGRSDPRLKLDRLSDELGVPPGQVAETPQVQGDPLMSYRLAELAQTANQASRSLSAVPPNAPSQRFWEGTANLSHALRELNMTLNGLDPATMSVPESWQIRMLAWREQLEGEVRNLKAHAEELQRRLGQQQARRPQAAGPGSDSQITNLQFAIAQLQSVLRQVELDLAASSADFN